MKKLLVALLVLGVSSNVFADINNDFDFVDVHALSNRSDNVNPSGIIAPDFNKEPSLSYKAWQATKDGADSVLTQPLEKAGEKLNNEVTKEVNKVFEPWEKQNKHLEEFVKKQKKDVKKQIIGLIWYYFSRKN